MQFHRTKSLRKLGPGDQREKKIAIVLDVEGSDHADLKFPFSHWRSIRWRVWYTSDGLHFTMLLCGSFARDAGSYFGFSVL